MGIAFSTLMTIGNIKFALLPESSGLPEARHDKGELNKQLIVPAKKIVLQSNVSSVLKTRKISIPPSSCLIINFSILLLSTTSTKTGRLADRTERHANGRAALHDICPCRVARAGHGGAWTWCTNNAAGM